MNQGVNHFRIDLEGTIYYIQTNLKEDDAIRELRQAIKTCRLEAELSYDEYDYHSELYVKLAEAGLIRSYYKDVEA